MWRAYKRGPEEYVEELLAGTISKATGEEKEEDHEEEEDLGEDGYSDKGRLDDWRIRQQEFH